ncbi:MAG: hypothetical protein ACI90V_004852, partial [Bacillariaceae sp.]
TILDYTMRAKVRLSQYSEDTPPGSTRLYMGG